MFKPGDLVRPSKYFINQLSAPLSEQVANTILEIKTVDSGLIRAWVVTSMYSGWFPWLLDGSNSNAARKAMKPKVGNLHTTISESNPNGFIFEIVKTDEENRWWWQRIFDQDTPTGPCNEEALHRFRLIYGQQD